VTVEDAVHTRLIAGPDDLAAAVRVWHLANVARGKVPDENRRARVRTKLAEADALAVVATRIGKVSGDEVVGMALAEAGRDDNGAGAVLPYLCHVSMVFVHPDRWGRRIGQRLLDTVAEHAARRGQTVLQLWTGQANHRAHRLYQRAGFRPTGDTRLLPSGEPIIRLARILTAAPGRRPAAGH
jgi:GNAT superfamily N-acetyltransferase